MPMLKKYSELEAQPKEHKIGISRDTINFLLNMSKSLEGKQVKKEKVLVHLN